MTDDKKLEILSTLELKGAKEGYLVDGDKFYYDKTLAAAYLANKEGAFKKALRENKEKLEKKGLSTSISISQSSDIKNKVIETYLKKVKTISIDDLLNSGNGSRKSKQDS